MNLRIYTMGIPMAVVLNVDTANTIVVRGSDPSRANTIYFQQRIPIEYVKGVGNKLRFNLPLVPKEYLNLEIVDEGQDKTHAELLDITCDKLKTKPVFLLPHDAEYIKQAMWMSQNAGTLEPAVYKEGNVIFELFDTIVDSEKGALTTPARVDHNTGTVQIAKKYFDQYTVPMRMFILAHERVHFIKDTQSEVDADLNALNICLRLGFPKMELLYAATKIFPDTPESRERVNAMLSFINNY